MRKTLVPGVVLLLVTFCGQATVALPAAHRTQSSAEASDATRNAIREAFFDVRNNEWEVAAAAFDGAIHSKGFANLPEDLRYAALLTAGQIAEKADKHGPAHGLLVQATSLAQADSAAWIGRLSAAFAMSDYKDSGLCLATIARRWPETLDQINAPAIYRIEYELDEPALAGDRLAVLQALFDAKWLADDPEASPIWRDLSLDLIGRHDIAKARVVAERVRSARDAIIMRVDKRFDVLAQGNPNLFDINRIAAEELAIARANVKSKPAELRLQTALQGVLMDALQFNEVIAIADTIIAKSAGGAGQSLYSDYDEQYIWILDHRARALAALGRTEEAIAQWDRSARHPEDGGVNVSQALNLGLYYAELRRPKDALDITSELGSVSPYGRMQLEEVQLLAAIEQADKPAIAAHLAFMRGHRDDAISTWQDALMASGDLDGAADLLIERLMAEKWRSGALADIQDYGGVAADTPIQVERAASYQSILARPKVRKAVDKVGRIERFDLGAQQI